MIRVVLREDQWDLIVCALQHIVSRVDDAAGIDNERIHILARRVTRRRCVETIEHIQAQAPEAGK